MQTLSDPGSVLDSDTSALPTHIEDTVRLIAEIHAQHDLQASLYQRAIQRIIVQVGRPSAVAVIAVLMTLWVVANVVLIRVGVRPFDPAPFSYLQGLVTAAALLMTVLILTSQRHENRLAERRAQLTLELAMVSEQKVAKLIELVEHQRRDNPQIADRVDEEAAAMAKPADPHAIFHAVKATHSEMVAGDNLPAT